MCQKKRRLGVNKYKLTEKNMSHSHDTENTQKISRLVVYSGNGMRLTTWFGRKQYNIPSCREVNNAISVSAPMGFSTYTPQQLKILIIFIPFAADGAFPTFDYCRFSLCGVFGCCLLYGE